MSEALDMHVYRVEFVTYTMHVDAFAESSVPRYIGHDLLRCINHKRLLLNACFV
jgi:hypothetical protein